MQDDCTPSLTLRPLDRVKEASEWHEVHFREVASLLCHKLSSRLIKHIGTRAWILYA